MEEPTLVATVCTLEHPLKPAATIKGKTRFVRLIVFMNGTSKNLLRLALSVGAPSPAMRATVFRDSF
jgi:hypothetical protein